MTRIGSTALAWAGRRVAAAAGRPAQPGSHPAPAPGWHQQVQAVRDAILNPPYLDLDRVCIDAAALDRLAEASTRMSPWDAAVTIFGGQQ